MLLFDVAFHTVLAIPTLTTWRQLQLHSRKSHSNGESVVFMHLYLFRLSVPMGEHKHNCFLGLGYVLCCSSIYGVKEIIAPK